MKAQVNFDALGGGNITVEQLIPRMTTATAPSGEVTASNYWQQYYPYSAFDERDEGVENKGWTLSSSQSSGTANQWLQYEFPEAVTAKFARIIPFYSTQYGKNRTRQYKYQASNDNFVSETKDLTETLTFQETDFFARLDQFTKNVGSYKYYRIFIISSGGGDGCGCNALQLYTY